MEDRRIKSIIESLVFASPEPLRLSRIIEIIEEAEKEDVRRCAAELIEEWRASGRGLIVEEVAGGFQLRTAPDNAPWVLKLQKTKRWRLSRAALETLAIIAYLQPITRAEVDELRRVDSGGVVRQLLDRKFIKVAGKKEVPGRPLLLATTSRFLEFFGLKSLGDMPTLEEVSTLGELEGAGLNLDELSQVRDELLRRQGELEGDGLEEYEETDEEEAGETDEAEGEAGEEEPPVEEAEIEAEASPETETEGEEEAPTAEDAAVETEDAAPEAEESAPEEDDSGPGDDEPDREEESGNG